jgi:peptidoglycan/LPS O-acetylase OafA/YrhL
MGMAIPTAPAAGPVRDAAEGRARRAYVPELDGVRALAVMMVLLHHISVPYLLGGFIGVSVFFVLSGYLISSLLLGEIARTGGVNLAAFFRRRATRLYPALVVAVGLAIVVALVDHNEVGDTIVGAPLALGYATNLAGWRGWAFAGFLSHTWSLAVEAQFYLLWPLVLVWLGRRHRVAAGCLALAAAFMALSLLNTEASLTGDTYYFPPFSAVPLLLGAWLAAARRQGALEGRRTLISVLTWAGLAASAAVALTARAPHAHSMLDVGYPIVFLASTALVAGLVRGGVPLLSWLFALPFAVWIGQRSYGIYLYHYAYTIALIDHPTAVRLPVVLVLTFATAEASWRLLEQPLLRRGRGIRGHVEESRPAIVAAPARA